MIEECILNEWKRQAERDGNLFDYEYHLGMIYPPLPYQKWKLKKNLLDLYQKRPEYIAGNPNPGLDRRVNQLCEQLGY